MLQFETTFLIDDDQYEGRGENPYLIIINTCCLFIFMHNVVDIFNFALCCLTIKIYSKRNQS